MSAVILKFDPAKRRARPAPSEPCTMGFGWLNPWLDAAQLWQGMWLGATRTAAQAWLDVTEPARRSPARGSRL